MKQSGYWLYGVRHDKDESDSKRKTPLSPLCSLFYMPYPTDRVSHHDLCYTSCGALAGMRHSSMDPRNYISLPVSIPAPTQFEL